MCYPRIISNYNFKLSKFKIGYKNMSEVKKLEIVSDINIAKVFIQEKRQPFILRGLDIGECTSKWTFEYLKIVGKDQQVKVHVSPCEKMDFINKNFLYRSLSFSELIERASTKDKLKEFFINENEKYYLRTLGADERKDVSDIKVQFPALASDIKFPELFDTKQFFSSVFRISSPLTRLWTHYDIMDNILMQVTGNKKVVLYAPSDVDYLYLKGDKSQVLDIENPDLNQYPLFQKAKRYECLLTAGDVLFIPALWFHNVISLDFSVAVNVFWRHLDESFYEKKDLYGNKDLVNASKAFLFGDKALKELSVLPQEYKDFYTRRLIETLKNSLSK